MQNTTHGLMGGYGLECLASTFRLIPFANQHWTRKLQFPAEAAWLRATAE